MRVAGIDVGGVRKGFHAVVLHGAKVTDLMHDKSADRLAAWLRSMDVSAIAVDAPCSWSADGRARSAERVLMSQAVWCFSTPTREVAVDHPRQHYDWMLNGERLYQALGPTHPLHRRWAGIAAKQFCLETYPHAVTAANFGGHVRARDKRRDRRHLT